MKKILVTGANGLLGQKLVNLILEKKEYKLIATSRGEDRQAPKEGYQYSIMDVTDSAQVLQVIAQHQPDYLIHTAAMTNVDQCEENKEDCWKQNVDAVKYLVDSCQIHNVSMIHLSTDFIFDGKEGPYDEDATPNPINYYGESKLAAENIIKKSSLQWSIIRTVLVYGIVPNMSRSNIILWVKKSLEDKKKIKVVDDQWRSPTLAEDLAMGCYLAVKNNATGVYNVSGSDILTPYQMAVKTAKFFDLNIETMTKADSTIFQQPAKRPPKTGFNIDKAIKELGYKPHSFDEGIAKLSLQLKKT